MLSDDELDGMRVTVVEALPELGAVERATPAADDLGGVALTWATLDAHVPMRLAPLDGAAIAEEELAGRASNSKRWNVYLPAGTDIAPADRIVLDGRTFDVDSIAAPRSWELAVRVVVNEVR